MIARHTGLSLPLTRACRSSARRAAARRAASTSAPPLKIALVGAGPSGFYTASRVLHLAPPSSALGQRLQVHMYERLPTPYGLARYGVAPDHPEVKNCQHKFDELAADPRFSFFGNVVVGPAHAAPAPASTPSPPAPLSPYTYPSAVRVPLAALLAHYDAAVLTYGSSLSNPLGIPGSTSSAGAPPPLAGVLPALALVSWYNGHPAFAELNPALARARAVEIVGQGNVALDVARVLLSPPAALAATDMPSPVVAALAGSGVRAVRAVGRRGPGQVAFTTKEFREMARLPGVAYPGVDAGLMRQAQEMVGHERGRRRLLDLMAKPVEPASAGKMFELAFLRSPTAFLPADRAGAEGARHVGAVEYAVNALALPPPPGPAPPASQAEAVPRPAPRAVMTPARETVRADMVVESVGYRSEAIGDVPFDAARGRVRNDGGRVVAADGQPVPGLYAAGWAARGPVGVIASTMADAFALSSMLLADLADPALPRRPAPQPGEPDALAAGRRAGRLVDMARWARIDRAEVERGRKAGKPREKFLTVDEMLAV